MEAGVKFEDGKKVEWAMAAAIRGVKDAYAASFCQVTFYKYFRFLYYTKRIIFLYNRLSYLLFYLVHIRRMLTLHYYRLLHVSVFKLNKRDLNC
jgi:hypothetical protein